MMNNGKCPKCASESVYKRKQGYFTSQNHISISQFSTVLPTYLVCTTCGYLETYIEDLGALSQIQKKWERVF